ncbi:hypothetical protein SAMN04489841_1115 [Natrinema salaciae]|uniref:Uncharacterized protein n=1 Tax=Natrinema salaciae TaxID=1186196 RepID=A0A1H9CPC6_9EURY|nr:hypothetical protein SAMN04489841_1115 [Natrinema salaciae]
MYCDLQKSGSVLLFSRSTSKLLFCFSNPDSKIVCNPVSELNRTDRIAVTGHLHYILNLIT